jgi:hypothetical protein
VPGWQCCSLMHTQHSDSPTLTTTHPPTHPPTCTPLSLYYVCSRSWRTCALRCCSRPSTGRCATSWMSCGACPQSRHRYVDVTLLASHCVVPGLVLGLPAGASTAAAGLGCVGCQGLAMAALLAASSTPPLHPSPPGALHATAAAEVQAVSSVDCCLSGECECVIDGPGAAVQHLEDAPGATAAAAVLERRRSHAAASTSGSGSGVSISSSSGEDEEEEFAWLTPEQAEVREAVLGWAGQASSRGRFLSAIRSLTPALLLSPPRLCSHTLPARTPCTPPPPPPPPPPNPPTPPQTRELIDSVLPFDATTFNIAKLRSGGG